MCKLLDKKLFFFLVVAVIFYKSPYIFLNGRFVAEEGEFWFKNSYEKGALFGIFQIFYQSGYFNLWANIASVLATYVPLEYAPLVTVYCALFIKLYLIFFILNNNSSLLITKKYKYLASLIILFSPFMVEEIWLNTLTSQAYLTIFSILYLFKLDENKEFLKYLNLVFLFIAAMSSVTTIILFPFFLYNFIKKNKLIPFLIIFLSGFLQTSIYIYARYTDLYSAEYLRYHYSYEKIINFIYNIFLKSFLGKDLTQSLFLDWGLHNNKLLILFLIFIIFFFFLFFFLKKIKKDRILAILILIFIIQSVLAFIGSKMFQVQGRYAVVPCFVLLMLVLRFYQTEKGLIKNFYLFLIISSILTGIYHYKYRPVYPEFLNCINCPNWKNEVKKWRLDKDYKLKIWHYPMRTMNLN